MAAIEQLLPEYVTRAGNFKVILGKSDINLLHFFLTKSHTSLLQFLALSEILNKINLFCFKNCR